MDDKMVDFNSSNFPTTKKVMITGGGVTITGSTILDTSHNDSFTPSFDTGIWTEDGGNVNVTKVNGSPMRLDIDASGGAAQYLLNGSVANESPSIIDVGYILKSTTTLVGDCIVLKWTSDSGLGNFFTMDVIRDESGASVRIDIEYKDSTMGGSTVSSTTFDKTAAKFRLVFTPDDKFFLYESGSLLDSFDFVLDWAPNWDIGVVFPSDAANIASVFLTPVIFNPVLEGVLCRNETGIPLFNYYHSGQAGFQIDPAFPGNFPLTLHGIGSAAGLIENIGTVEVLSSTNLEDSLKLVVSPIETFYDDAEQILACRNFALTPTIRQRTDEARNRGDLIAPMRCVDDGTVQNSDRVDIVSCNTGRLDTFDNRVQNPEFYLSDLSDPDNPVNYGSSFRFDKIPDLTASLLTDSLRNLRCLNLANGDRFYYGVLYTPLTAKQDLTINAPGGVNYTLSLLGSDNLESTIVQGVDIETVSPLTILAPPGRYRLDIDGLSLPGNDITIDIFKGTTVNDPQIIHYFNTSSEDDSPEVYFEIKPNIGKFVYFLYDRAANDWRKFESIHTDVSLRTDSFSAVELDDGDIALIYEVMPDEGLFDNRTQTLSYRVVNRQTGGLSSTPSEIVLPADLPTDGDQYLDDVAADEFQWTIHAFDVVKTNDTLNIFIAPELWSDRVTYIVDKDGREGSTTAKKIPKLNNGFLTLIVQDGVITFTGDHALQNFNIASTRCVSLERLFKYTQPDDTITDVLADGSGLDATSSTNLVRIGVDYIKGEYDSERDLIVVSILDLKHRAPIVFAGKDFVYSEVGIPHHFGVADFIYLQGSFYSDFDYFGLDSLHAAFGFDGQIYTVATADGVDFNMELGILDPQLFYSATEHYIDFIQAEDEPDLTEFDIFASEFRFEATPILSTYNPLGTGAAGTVVAVAQASLSDGEILTLSDGVFNQTPLPPTDPGVVFEFSFDGILNVPGRVLIDLSAGGLTAIQVADQIVAAINSLGPSTFPASYLTADNVGGTSATVTITNSLVGNHGNVETWSTDSACAITQPSGGERFQGVRTASITRQNQYMVIPCGTDEVGFPIIFHGMEYDTIPFSTQEEEIWTPIFAENTQWVKNVSAVYNDESLDIAAISFGSTPTGIFERILTTDDVPEDRHENSDIGYKFHARVSAAGSTPSVLNGLNLNFVASARRDDNGTFRESLGQMVMSAGDILCQVWNPDTTTFDTVHTFSSAYTASQIVDLFIIVRNADRDKNNFFFCYKIRSENIAPNGPSGEYEFDFRSTGDFFVATGLTDNTIGDANTTFRVEYQGITGGTHVMRVFQMGWNTITARKGSVFFEGGKGTAVGPPLDGRNPGASWQPLDDAILFDHKANEPDYKFKPDKILISQKTVWFHWPNGFEYTFSGNRAVIRDAWELSREVLNNTTSLPTKKFHGFWRTLNDDTDVYLWADSFDSDLDKFEVDTFLIDGGNLAQYTIVGKDNLIDPWVEIDTIDMSRYKLTGITGIDKGDDIQIAEVANANFNKSTFNEFDYYFTDIISTLGPGAITLKVVDNSSDRVYLEPVPGDTLAESFGQVFSSRGSKILDTPIRYRFIGIKLIAHQTFEGRFQLKTFDFGRAREIPLLDNHSLSSNIAFEGQGKISFVHDDLGFPTVEKTMSKVFDLDYTTMDALTFVKYKSILDKVTLNRRVIWVVEHYNTNKEHVYMCLADKEVSTNVVLDENGDRVYRLNIQLKSIK